MTAIAKGGPRTSATTIEQRAAELARSGTVDDEAVTELLGLAEGQRGPLEAAAHSFADRLHRRSDDFEATNALRLVNRALTHVGWDTNGSPGVAPAGSRSHYAVSSTERSHWWRRLRRRGRGRHRRERLACA
jgi:hypothetical protein